MKTEVLLERLPDDRYRASGTGRFAISVDGSTREDALNNFQKAARSLMLDNAELVILDIPVEENHIPTNDPWAWFAGIAKNDPLYPLFLEQIELNRQEDEEKERQKVQEDREG